MENHEFDEGIHEANWHIHAYDKRKAVEKATDKLIRDEEATPERRERLFQDVEVWQVFPVNTFR